MELEYYFDPVKPVMVKAAQRTGEGLAGREISFISEGSSFDPEIFDVAVIGVEAGVNSPGNESCSKAPDAIRSKLYGLRYFNGLKVADLGNIKGNTANDKLIALADVTSFLIENSVIPLVIGGSHDLTISLAAGTAANSDSFNISVIDPAIDYSDDPDGLTSSSFLSRLHSGHGDKIGSLSLIGVQKYFYSKQQEDFIYNNFYDLIRLGEIRGENIKSVEPFLRDTDVLSVDISSVKKSDMPAWKGAMPNGFSSHEICRLAWYAGMSDRIKAFGLFELNPDEDDKAGSGVALAAQVLWYFMEGLSLRHKDYPVRDIETYSTYIVHLEDMGLELKFFNNPQNGRWWVEIPGIGDNLIVSCSKDDYENALKNDISDRLLFLTKKK